MKVLCLADRYIGDDQYAAGEEYEMEADRLERYAAYFSLIPEPEEEEEENTKNRRGFQDKDGGKNLKDKEGWPNRQGQNVKLDGTPTE